MTATPHHMPEQLDPEPSSSAPNLLHIAWRRKSLIVLGAAIGCVLGALYYSQQKPVYRSQAQVLVIKKDAGSLVAPTEMFVGFDDYLSTHMVLLRSPMLIKQAVNLVVYEDGDPVQLAPWISVAGSGALAAKREVSVQGLDSMQGRESMSAVMAGLSVARNEKTAAGTPANILTLAFQGPNSRECKVAIDAVIKSYEKYLEKTYESTTEDSSTLFKKAQDIHENDLKATKERYKKFREGRKTLVLARDGSAGKKLTPIEDKLQALGMRRADLKVRIEGIENALENDEDPTPFLLMAPVGEAVKSDRETAPSTDATFFDLVTKERDLLEHYGKDYHEVRSVRARLEMLKKFTNNKESLYQQFDLVPHRTREEARTQAKDHVAALKRELLSIAVTEKATKELYQRQAEEYTKYLNDETEDKEFKNEIDRGEKLYGAILGRISEAKVARPLGGFKVDVIFPPDPGAQVAPRAMPIFLVALFCGLCGGFGLAWLADVSDKSFRTPEEIRRRLGLAIVGHIPSLIADEESKQKAAAAGNVLDPLLVVHYRSRSIEAESFRGVRTAVYFKAQEAGMKVIQVTSPNKGDGKSTVTANLAISIAQSGKRVLLIDADFRRPRQHKIFGDKGDTGVVSVLTGATELQDAMRPTGVPNLSLLPCGPRPNNPAELLTSPAFHDLIDFLRQHFDYVLIDTPPLLAVSDPSIVAPHVDGVLLTIRVSRNGRPHAERAKELLATLNAPVIGVIVNGISKRGKNGYDKSYGYNYGYSYGYSYTYSYESDENKSYYQDPDGMPLDSAESPYVGAGAAVGDPDEPEEVGVNGSAERNGRHPKPGNSLIGWISRLWQ